MDRIVTQQGTLFPEPTVRLVADDVVLSVDGAAAFGNCSNIPLSWLATTYQLHTSKKGIVVSAERNVYKTLVV